LDNKLLNSLMFTEKSIYWTQNPDSKNHKIIPCFNSINNLYFKNPFIVLPYNANGYFFELSNFFVKFNIIIWIFLK